MLLQWRPYRLVTLFGPGRTSLGCFRAVDVVKRRSGFDYSHTQRVFCVGKSIANYFNLRRPSSAPIEENFYCIKSGDRKVKEEEDRNVK